MMNSCRSLVPFHPQMLRTLTAKLQQPRMQLVSQSFAIGFLAAVGLASGWVPSLSERSPEQMFSTAAVAQAAPSAAELKSYARAVLAVEEVRQVSYRDIKKLVGSSGIPAIACHRPKSLQGLPQNVRGIAVEYCNKSKKIVESNGLTIDKFNAITVNVQSDPNLEKRVQAELLELQKPSR
ncbi:DUF4168 domain-containing protein [Trichocoleus sp. FACHB-591]|uniref:DUF4168 domain-containing protein n=1 Tax=Trichocoleus sp. FACHB-591 TaxID=2692872 RepID=UPI0018F03E00|nr:DUF4168 domain-containing protein [Trichocoleus sp. FACHB-591]